MYMRIADNVDDIYLDLCESVINGNKVANTHELNNICVQLTNIDNNVVSIRNISDIYLLAELVWYFSGREDVKFIGSFASTWKKLTDDGETVNSAYGCCIKSRYGFDQAEKIVELLKKDPDSRRAVINLNVPNPFVIETKDELCTIALQFMIRNKKLNCTCMMRSNDIWFGFPYDIVFFTELQRYLAIKLEIEPGTYTHFATSFHVYDRDFKKIETIVVHPHSKHIDFNRYNLYEFAETISNEMDAGFVRKEDPKKLFINLLSKYGVYERSNK